MRLGDFKRLVLWQKPEPFIVNHHLVNNSEKLEDIFERHGGSNVLNFQYDLRKYFLFILRKEDGELEFTMKESSAYTFNQVKTKIAETITDEVCDDYINLKKFIKNFQTLMKKIQVESEIIYKIRLFVQGEDGHHEEILDETTLLEENQLYSEEERRQMAIKRFYGSQKAVSLQSPVKMGQTLKQQVPGQRQLKVFYTREIIFQTDLFGGAGGFHIPASPGQEAKGAKRRMGAFLFTEKEIPKFVDHIIKIVTVLGLDAKEDLELNSNGKFN